MPSEALSPKEPPTRRLRNSSGTARKPAHTPMVGRTAIARVAARATTTASAITGDVR